MHTKVQRLQERAQRLQKRDDRLAEHNRLLTARLSGRYYKLADTIVAIAARTPVLGKLILRRTTTENRQSWN